MGKVGADRAPRNVTISKSRDGKQKLPLTVRHCSGPSILDRAGTLHPSACSCLSG